MSDVEDSRLIKVVGWHSGVSFRMNLSGSSGCASEGYVFIATGFDPEMRALRACGLILRG